MEQNDSSFYKRFWHCGYLIPFGTHYLNIWTASFSKCPVNFMHKHNCYEVHFNLNGKVKIFTEKEKYELDPGELCWISPGVLHTKITDTGKDTNINLSFSFTRSNDYLSTKLSSLQENDCNRLMNIIQNTKFWIGPDTAGCEEILRRILKNIDDSAAGYVTMVQNGLVDLIIAFVRCIINKKACIGMQNTPGVEFSRVGNSMDIMKYVQENYYLPLTLESVAEEFNLSERQVNRLLNEGLGLPFKKMLSEVRLGFAQMYLKESGYSVSQISELVGFSSPEYFRRVFKSTFGFSPLEYRNIQKAEQSVCHRNVFTGKQSDTPLFYRRK